MNDELTNALSRELHEQVDDWQGAPLTLERVQGRARSIRRTRRLAAGAVVAAAVGLVVPTALFLGDGPGGSAQREIPPATSSPSEGPSGSRAVDTNTPDPDTGRLGVPYVVGTTLVTPEGEQELPRRYGRVVLLGNRTLGLYTGGNTGRQILNVIEDGTVVDLGEADNGLAANAAGTTVAWSTPDGELMTMWEDGEVSLGDQGNPVIPVAVTGGPDCHESADGCVVYYNSQGQQPPMSVSSHGNRDVVASGALSVEDATEDGRVAVMTSVDDFEPGSCSQVIDQATSETVFETCDATLSRFSPDGSYLSGNEDYLDGIGAGEAKILDATTGTQLVNYRPGNGYISHMAWEDAEHLLVVTYSWDDQSWSVVRLGVDGSREQALEPIPGHEARPEYLLVGSW
jgi:hypothetical protein